jgi:AAA+ ATPase superfamily predicted ATPase
VQIVGRANEQRVLQRCLESKKPEFIAVYGRRRVGKTYLVREFFENKFAFYLTGSADKGMSTQLDYFNEAVQLYSNQEHESAKSWMDAFRTLRKVLENSNRRYKGKRVVFIDEIAWLDTRKSGFLLALEHFWNSWGSAQPDLILVVCGSASSWIIKKLFKNRGGLHNRITRRLRLEPFRLVECEQFFTNKGIHYNRRLIAEAYMVFGGIPFYLDLFEPGFSVVQNVDAICFSQTAPLRDEFNELYASLFEHEHNHIQIVKALASKRAGLTRDELIQTTGLSSGGTLTNLLEELEQSGFIRRYYDYRNASDNSLYQLLDFFSLYFLTFMSKLGQHDEHFWSKLNGKGAYNAWIGLSFELLCLSHIDQVKDGLGIYGVSTSVYAWRSPTRGLNRQIDLVIDRADGIIDICESKYSREPYAINKSDAQKMQSRCEEFSAYAKADKAIHMIMIASAGLKQNAYSHVIEKTITLDDLFRYRDD